MVLLHRRLGVGPIGHVEGHGLGTPQDITLQELRVECFHPGDEATEALTRRLAAPSP